MSGFELGVKAVKKLVVQQEALAFHHAKLSTKLFKGEVEKQVFDFVADHLGKYQTLPQLATLETKFPELKTVECPEPPKYYLDKITERFEYDAINRASKEALETLKGDQHATEAARTLLFKAMNEITEQRYRHRIMDVGKEALSFVLQSYFNMTNAKEKAAVFGWEYMDVSAGGILAGDVVSIVGRPAMGKSFFTLYIAIVNWLAGRNVLFVSMEMNTLATAQRICAMYAHTNLTQLKIGGYSKSTYTTFVENVKGMAKETGKLYVVDGNLAANVEEIYVLSAQLNTTLVLIDGGYLLRHKDKRLGRYEKVAENVELMKRYATDLEIPTVASWQFARSAVKDNKKGAKVKGGLEDIGYTDAIGQISSIVLGLMQEDGIETMQTRLLDVMKGRNGEVGQFRVNWDFQAMDFTEVATPKKLEQFAEQSI